MTDVTSSPRTSGLDLSSVDPAVRPQDDLFRAFNGTWLREHEIPADRSVDGAFRVLRDDAEEAVHAIVEEAAASPDDFADPALARKIGDLYTSFMAADRVEELGSSPLAVDLDLIRSATSPAELAGVLGALQRTGVRGPVGAMIDTDMKDPDAYVVYVAQSGLGLPDEAYYREEQHAEVRARYAEHVTRLLGLAGLADLGPDAAGPADGASAGERVLALETKIAAHHWDVVRRRDPQQIYNPTSLADLEATAPGFAWAAWFAAQGVGAEHLGHVVALEPDALAGTAALWASEPLADWRLWAAMRVVSARAPYLSAAFVDEAFDFGGRTLSGTPENRERWKRGVSLVEGALGEAVGQLYVERHFPPAHKARMDELVANLLEAYRVSITRLDWMSPATRERALDKLSRFTPKIGYPVRWRDYSALVVDADDLVGNVRRANAFENDREVGKLGGPVDRDEWYMTPQTVNAYYNPGMNEIVFPAAILRPPFFDPDADDAANYGGIGAVIGHEIGHGFDDQGSKFDGTGRLEDWWTDEDRAEFERRTARLGAQYDAYVPAQLAPDGPHVNGALTMGENIGDLGGLAIALKAYSIAVTGGPDGVTDGSVDEAAPVLDGFTPTQRVFLGWAQVWRSKGRDAEVRRRIATDPHSPDEFRCNGVVRNLDAFHRAFDVQPGDGAYLAPEERVSIW